MKCGVGGYSITVVCTKDAREVLHSFRYQPHDSAYGEIHEYITYLDHEGMKVGGRCLRYFTCVCWYIAAHSHTLARVLFAGYDWTTERLEQLIERIDATGFAEYLEKTRNTICGRHPISLLLHTILASSSLRCSLKFVEYAQSSACMRHSDSSVSYASAIVYNDP